MILYWNITKEIHKKWVFNSKQNFHLLSIKTLKFTFHFGFSADLQSFESILHICFAFGFIQLVEIESTKYSRLLKKTYWDNYCMCTIFEQVGESKWSIFSCCKLLCIYIQHYLIWYHMYLYHWLRRITTSICRKVIKGHPNIKSVYTIMYVIKCQPDIKNVYHNVCFLK
jgi:hypothetical protein